MRKLLLAILILFAAAQACFAESADESLMGAWTVDTEKSDYSALREAFGSGLSESTGMQLSPNGSIRFNLGYGFGGEGTYSLQGNVINATVKSYSEGATQTAQIGISAENGRTYLTMNAGEVTVYWVKTDASATYDDLISAYEAALAASDPGEALEEAGLNRLAAEARLAGAKVGFTYMDLDGDGTDELLICCQSSDDFFSGMVIEAYRVAGGSPASFLSGAERDRYYLCPDLTILNAASSGAADSSFSRFRLADGALSPVQAVKYDALENPDAPWFAYENGAWSPVDDSRAMELLGLIESDVFTPELTPFGEN